MFDETMDLADKSRPFYEFGVWIGISFKYLIKILEIGFYCDTFYRLPQHWHNNKGTYSSKGIIPEIDGVVFIVGKFEDTLQTFFQRNA